jgi:hypothetical protein
MADQFAILCVFVSRLWLAFGIRTNTADWSVEQPRENQQRWAPPYRGSKDGMATYENGATDGAVQDAAGKVLDTQRQSSSYERASSVASRFSTIALIRPLIATNSAA